MKWFIICIGLLAISGCASVDMAKKAVVLKATEVSDTLLDEAVWFACVAAPIGSVNKKWGMTTDRANLYKEFCFGQDNANVIGP